MGGGGVNIFKLKNASFHFFTFTYVFWYINPLWSTVIYPGTYANVGLLYFIRYKYIWSTFIYPSCSQMSVWYILPVITISGLHLSIQAAPRCRSGIYYRLLLYLVYIYLFKLLLDVDLVYTNCYSIFGLHLSIQAAPRCRSGIYYLL